MAFLFSLGEHSVRPHVILYPLGVWIGMAVVAIVNGGLREILLVPRIGEYVGHVVSTAFLVGAILVISFLYFSRTSIEYAQAELVLIGALWTILTVGFEFLVGYVEGTPVSVTVGQYNVLAGHVWIAVPLTVFFAPLVFGRYLSV